MTDSIVYTQCPFCPKVIRKDKMVVHLCTHSKAIVAHMPIIRRKFYLEAKKPFISLCYDEETLFLCCIHCKKGYLNQTKHRTTFNKVNHNECSKAFHAYESMYESIVPAKPIALTDWKLVKKERTKSTAVTAVVDTEEPVVSVSLTPAACAVPMLSADMESKIIDAWKADRDPDDNDVESDEETTDGKLEAVLKSFHKMIKIIDNNRIAIQKITEKHKQEINKLENDLGKMEDKEQAERNAKEIAQEKLDKLLNGQN